MGWAKFLSWVTILAVMTSHSSSWAEENQDAESEAQEARSDVLGPARAAIDSAQFDIALKLLGKLLATGTTEPEQVIETYRLIGETSVAVGKTADAMAAFRVLLVLQPEATLGQMVSPKIVEVFEAARIELAGAALVVRHQLDPGTRQLSVVVESDPVAMIAGVRVTYHRADGSTAQLSLPIRDTRAELDVPGQATGSLEIALLDASGNTLRALELSGLEAVVGKSTPGLTNELAPSATNTVSAVPLWRKWWVWAGAAGVAAATGTAFGIASQNASSDLDARIADPRETFFGEAEALEDKARNRALWANLSFAAAAGLGVASAVFYWQERSLEVVHITATTDGQTAVLVVGGRF